MAYVEEGVLSESPFGLMFSLYRVEDESGISGVGFVANGIVLLSGRVVLEWRPPHDGIIIYRSAEEAYEVHGHNGLTRIEYGWPEW